MSFFKKIFQSVLNEEDGNIKKEIVLKEEQYKTSKITGKLEKGNNGVFGDEYEEDEDDNIHNNKPINNIEGEEEEESNSDSTNYRDKDKEARRKYIEKIKKQSLLIAQIYEKYKKAKKDSGRKEGSGRKSGDWGKRTSERNLNREIGGANRDYAGELRYELAMRRKKIRDGIAKWEAAKIVIRRRLKRMHINRRVHSNFFRYVLNFKKIKKSLKGLPVLINIKAAARKRDVNAGKIKAITKKIVKAKKIEKIKIRVYRLARERNQRKNKFIEAEKAKRQRKKAERRLNSI